MIAVLAALLLAAPAAAAQPAPVTIASSEQRVVQAADGTAYRLFIRRPAGAPPPGGWPSLWLLDGDQNFATAAEFHARLLRFSHDTVADGFIVGIASPDMPRRNRDYTPVADPRFRGMGGAAAFRAFLKAELLPKLGAELHLDPARRSLFGHSHGGLFTVDTLLSEPGMFATHVAASPSLWAATAHLDSLLAAPPADGAYPRLILTVGSAETGGPGGAFDGPAANAALERRLRAIGVAVRLRILEHENHGSAVLPAIGQSLPEVFAR